jgi:uncharacterized protein YndB with AHSA1/START domain
MEDFKKGIIIKRIFDSPRTLVWKAWTEPEMVKKWWGPKGFTAPSIKIDLKVGGKYIYCMHGPKGSEFDKDMYSSGIYMEIVPIEKLIVTDYFSDEKGDKIGPAEVGMDRNMPDELNVITIFKDIGNNKTELTIEYPRPESEVQFEAMLKSGMVDGWNSSLDKLAEFLESNKTKNP